MSNPRVKAPPAEGRAIRLRYQAAEVGWYRLRGKYPHRIKIDGEGHLYVVGDWAWNEKVDSPMARAIEGEG